MEKFSNITDVGIYPSKNSACKVIFKLSNFKKIESQKLTSNLANELEKIYVDYNSTHSQLKPEYLLVKGNLDSPGSMKLSEIKKRLGRENFVISFNERENFDFGSRELEEYEKLFNEILSGAKKSLADSKNAKSKHERIKQDFMEFTGVEKIEDLKNNPKIISSLETKLFNILPILNNDDEIEQFKSDVFDNKGKKIFEGNPGQKLKYVEKFRKEIDKKLKEHFKIDSLKGKKEDAKRKKENAKDPQKRNKAAADYNDFTNKLKNAEDEFKSFTEYVDELPRGSNKFAEDLKSARKGLTSPSRWREEDITMMMKYKFLLEQLKRRTIQYEISGNGFPWVIRNSSNEVVLEVVK